MKTIPDLQSLSIASVFVKPRGKWVLTLQLERQNTLGRYQGYLRGTPEGLRWGLRRLFPQVWKIKRSLECILCRTMQLNLGVQGESTVVSFTLCRKKLLGTSGRLHRELSYMILVTGEMTREGMYSQWNKRTHK